MAQKTSKTSKFLKAVLSTVITLVLLWAVLYIQNNYFNKPDPVPAPIPDPDPPVVQVIDEDGIYTSKEDVALYIHTYNKLPKNFITKNQAKKYGWSSGGLDKYYENGCIGGDVFGNKEGLLPAKEGRIWYECDIDTLHQKKRGSKRIVFSSDGLIYYTGDHYESFELLYGNPER